MPQLVRIGSMMSPRAPIGSGVEPPAHTVNMTSSNMASLRSAIQAVQAGSGNKKIACLGDSITAGWGSNTTGSDLQNASRRANGWPAKLAALLATEFGISANIDNVFSTAGFGTTAQYNVYDPRYVWGANGEFSNAYSMGGTMFAQRNSGSKSTFTPANQFDRATVYLVNNTGNGFILQGDGVTAVTVTDSGIGFVRREIPVTFPGLTTAFGWSSSTLTPVSLCGIQTWNSAASQLFVANIGRGGWTSTDFAAGAQSANYGPMVMLGLYAPDFSIINYRVNDENNAIGVETYRTNLRAIVDKCLLTGGAMLLGEGPTDDGSPHADYPTQALYRQVQIDVAIEKGIAFCDAEAIFGTWETANANGYMYDVSHKNAVGYAKEAQDVLLPCFQFAMAA